MTTDQTPWEETLPEEYQTALTSLYEKYGNAQTDAQKLNILIEQLGDCYVGTTADWRRTEEERAKLKLCVIELEYLEREGIHKPILM